jgi:N-acylneuraminate cytidylyltransferase/CMP-N,N'-diacetyllegionaminic acid synthase
MINNKKVLAIIPARGGSKGLPGKNIMSLCGKPLLGWPVSAACHSKFIDKVIVSTEDQKIADIALAQGAEIPFLRPEEFASDTATSFSVIKHALDFFKHEREEFEYCILLEPTSPLTESDDIDTALSKLEMNKNFADSIVGVSKIEAMHPVFDVRINEKGLIIPYVSDCFSAAGRRQDLDELFFFEGSLYISKTDSLLSKESFYHDRTLGYIVPKWKSLEIDDLVDFLCVEAVMKNLHQIKGIKA